LELGGGAVRGEIIEASFGNVDRPSAAARGEAYFFPQSTDAGLEHIHADELAIGGEAFEELLADGNVEIRLWPEQGRVVSFTGRRARFNYRDDAIAAAEWPVGLRYEDADEGMRMTAGYGALEPESGDWVLRAAAPGVAAADGDRRPRMSSKEFDVDADSIRLLDSDGVDLGGSVVASLRGEVIRTVGPLFGDAAEIEAAADELSLRGDNDRLLFTGNARISQPAGDQLLLADEISLRPATNELEAQGNVFVSLVDPADPDAGREEPRTIVLTGDGMLVEGSPPRLVIAGDALLELAGPGRRIGGERMAVELDEEGVWRSLEVFDNVVMTDPAGTGEGARLEYNADTGDVVIHAGVGDQATFVNDQGIDIRDRQGLRLEWKGESLEVTAMQNGTTQTVRGNQR
jgi:lipopolysaccharide export system protein LptA